MRRVREKFSHLVISKADSYKHPVSRKKQDAEHIDRDLAQEGLGQLSAVNSTAISWNSTVAESDGLSSSQRIPVGIKVLYDPSDAQVDICFIHGLSGNRERTWTAKGQSQPWPQTLLPPELPCARVLMYGYNAHFTRKPEISTNGLAQHAKSFLTDLTNSRGSPGASERPLIFVAHSFGGLICKETLLLSRDNPEAHLRDIFLCIKGIAFLGTPHRGAWMADWAKIPVAALGDAGFPGKSLLKVLSTDDDYLQSVQERFWGMIRQQSESGRKIEVTCFYEELATPKFGKIVPTSSATLEGYHAIGLHADHNRMAKFDSPEDGGFKRILGEISR